MLQLSNILEGLIMLSVVSAESWSRSIVSSCFCNLELESSSVNLYLQESCNVWIEDMSLQEDLLCPSARCLRLSLAHDYFLMLNFSAWGCCEKHSYVHMYIERDQV